MRALSRNTRRATAVTLAAALVIAVYLNWQYARSDVPTELPDNAAMVAAEVEDVPVQAQTVLDELPTEAEAVSSANKNYGEAQLVSVASDSGAKYFEQARLKRQKAHDEAMDSIKKTMKSSSLSAEEKKEYTAQMTANLEDLNAENEIETLIKAAGAELRYLPPYSPDMNPIEKAFSKLKAFLRKIAERTVAGLIRALELCAEIFHPAECEHYFQACGYDTG